jgi:hypothetical protein
MSMAQLPRRSIQNGSRHDRIADAKGLQAWDGFQYLCKLIAPASARPGAPSDRVNWGLVNWDVVIDQAEAHKVGPAVWRSIDGLAGVPNSVKAYFHVLRDNNAQRNAAMLDGLFAALARLNEIGIKAAPLKGGASIAAGLYDDPAERFLNDIDLLIPREDAQASTDALRALGYTDPRPDSRIRWIAPRTHHLPPLLAPSGFCIELHTAVVQRKFEPMLPGSEVLQRTSEARWRGRTIRFLHPTDQHVHNIVHSQLHDLSATGVVELRQLRELSFLIARYRSTIDWSDVERRFRAAGHEDVLRDQLAYCRMLMGVGSPIAEADPETSMQRLKAAVGDSTDHPRSGVAALNKLIRDYALWLKANPTLALGLINPLWWPRRIRLMLSLLKHDKNDRTE